MLQVLRTDAMTKTQAKPAMTFSNEVLVTKADLEEKSATISELRGKVMEMEMHNEYQLRLKDMTYTEHLKDLTEDFQKRIAAEVGKYEKLQQRKADREVQQKKEIRKLQVRARTLDK